MRRIVTVFAYALIAAAFVAFVADGQRWVANGALEPLSFGRLVQDIAPVIHAAIEPGVSRNIHPLVWTGLIAPIFASPTCLVLGILGAALMAAARRRQTPIGYASR